MSTFDIALEILARESVLAEVANEHPGEQTREEMLQEWEAAPDEDRAFTRELLRPALEAIAPLIAAQAIREAARDFAQTDPIETALGGMDYPIEWLEDRAAGLEEES